jgi:DNA-binding winged helix-turn-helix (wHTH) protein
MRYHINARFIYDATDGSLTQRESVEPDSQLSITANALFYFFLRNTGIVSREEVLKKVWDDNGLTSSNSNLNQYLSILRKAFRHYDIDNIIITVSRGYLQLNPEVNIEPIDNVPAPPIEIAPPPSTVTTAEPVLDPAEWQLPLPPRSRGICWYIAGGCMLAFALLLVAFGLLNAREPRPVTLTGIPNSQCELLASDEMLRSVSAAAYGEHFDQVRQRLNISCKPGERFLFFYGDRLETNGLGRVFLAHCAMHEDNPFSYCDNYFYYSWKP